MHLITRLILGQKFAFALCMTISAAAMYVTAIRSNETLSDLFIIKENMSIVEIIAIIFFVFFLPTIISGVMLAKERFSKEEYIILFGKKGVYREPNWTRLWFVYVDMLIILIQVPLVLIMLSTLGLINIFNVACGSIYVRDFYWFILDNIAKGAIIDFMQSYNINIYSCAQNNNFITSTIVFTIRIFSTYVVIWLGITAYKAIRQPIKTGKRIADVQGT